MLQLLLQTAMQAQSSAKSCTHSRLVEEGQAGGAHQVGF